MRRKQQRHCSTVRARPTTRLTLKLTDSLVTMACAFRAQANVKNTYHHVPVKVHRPQVGHINGSPFDASPESRSPARRVGQENRSPDEGLSTLPPLGHCVLSTESETSDREEAYATPSSITEIQFSSVAGDFLIKLYYKYFHRCHPCFHCCFLSDILTVAQVCAASWARCGV